MATKQELMLDMQLDIEEHLGFIEQVFQCYGLPMSGVTLIARDPADDNMIVVLTNEDLLGLEKACALAIKQQVVNHAREG